MTEIKLTPETIRLIEQVLAKGSVAETKVEHGKPVVIEVKRRLVRSDG